MSDIFLHHNLLFWLKYLRLASYFQEQEGSKVGKIGKLLILGILPIQSVI